MLCDILGNCATISDQEARQYILDATIGIAFGFAFILWAVLLSLAHFLLTKTRRWKGVSLDVFGGFGMAFFFAAAFAGTVAAMPYLSVDQWKVALLCSLTLGLTALLNLCTTLSDWRYERRRRLLGHS